MGWSNQRKVQQLQPTEMTAQQGQKQEYQTQFSYQINTRQLT